jgi:hypothetical protein
MAKPPFALLLSCLLGLGAAAGAQAQVSPPLPQGREPRTAPYDPFAHGQAPAPAPKAEPPAPGFLITVPLCREAKQANDPLANTTQCAALLKAAEDQAKACKQAFEDGDDKVALSAACRQAAGFR